MGCECNNGNCRGGFGTRPYNWYAGRAAVFAGTTHAAVRTACRGDAARRPATVVHSGRM